jgi:hypothetical protein
VILDFQALPQAEYVVILDFQVLPQA